MKAVVTGAAGFVGSTLCDRLLARGDEVAGVDCFTDYYPRSIKQRNVSGCGRFPRFRLLEADLLQLDLTDLLDGVDVVFHQAAQAGVRSSWGRDFEIYTQNNVLATQRLLEAALTVGLPRFVNASSSSVYGNCPDEVMNEDSSPTRPYSPYGVTKLAAEHLCSLYWRNFGLPTVSLRYFTVYGPRQRPDMALNRFISAVLSNQSLVLYGDGEQERDFTYVEDIATANLAAAEADEAPGLVMNVGGGSRITVNGVVELLGRLTDGGVRVTREGRQKGDVDRTAADTARARTVLDYRPSVSFEEGLARQLGWQRALAEERGSEAA